MKKLYPSAQAALQGVVAALQLAHLAQAEAEYRDFITFFPTMPEAGEAQMRVWSVDHQDGLDVTVSMSGPCPPRARGELSSGD